jgi:hypothetical protein
MPLDDDLAKAGQKKEEPKKEIVVPTNIVTFPAERVAIAYYRLRCAAPYSTGHFTKEFETKKLVAGLDSFIPYSDFYVTLRQNLDLLCEQLSDWRDSFDFIKQTEALQYKHEVPSATKEWAIQEIERNFAEINAALFPCEDLPYKEFEGSIRIEDWVNQMNTIYYQFKAENDLLQSVILGSSLLAKARQINDSFTVRQIPFCENPPVPGPEYIALVKDLRSRAVGSWMKLNFVNNEIVWIKDTTPKPKKKRWRGL